MKISRTGRSSNVIGFLMSQHKSKERQNNMMLIGLLILVIILGLTIYYFVSVRNQTDGFEQGTGDFAGLDISNKAEIEELLKDKKNVVFVFHKMQQCGHCKTFAPYWKKFSTSYKQPSNKIVHFKVVDMTDDLSDDVSGFPELRIYKSIDNYVSFDGNRNSDADLLSFINNNM